MHSDNTYKLSSCSCSGDTIFQDSVIVFRWRLEPITQYHVCFLNLTKEMNLTILHFYELYRFCDDDGNLRIKPYRNYVHSFKVLIGKKNSMLHFLLPMIMIKSTVLPEPPDISVDEMTGQVMFSSSPREGIPLDYYQVLIYDVSNQTVINNKTTDNNISVGDLFQQQKCSPYNVTVQAHNSQGFADSSVPVVINGGENGGKYLN